MYPPLAGSGIGSGIGSGSDYTQASTSITLTGQGEQVISVDLENDQIYEFAESFSASLSASGVLPSFVTLGPDMAQANIADDDSTLYIVIVLCCMCVHNYYYKDYNYRRAV